MTWAQYVSLIFRWLLELVNIQVLDGIAIKYIIMVPFIAKFLGYFIFGHVTNVSQNVADSGRAWIGNSVRSSWSAYSRTKLMNLASNYHVNYGEQDEHYGIRV